MRERNSSLCSKRRVEEYLRKRRGVVTRRVMSERHGYVTAIDVGEIARSVANAKSGHDESIQCGPNIEVALRVVLGSYVACRDLLAELRCGDPLADTQSVENSVIAAIILENERDLECDPDLGIAQLAIIGWTSVSTARSNPNPGILVCHALRDILARWLEQGAPPEDLSSRIVYEDRVPGAVIATLESLSVAASESMQHQTLAEILRTLASLLPKLSREGRNQVADVALRTLSSLGEHVLTRELEHALDILVQALTDTGCDGVAKALTRAKEALHQSVGVLNARSTRVPRNGAAFHHAPRE
jgi:uncharacterized membrane protein